MTLNSKLPKYYQELNTLPFLLYSYSMKNATKSTKAFFYELPQYMRSPIDEYYLIIIANSELEFDDRISNLKKLHPNLLSFIIQVGPVQTEYQNSLLKFGFEGRFYLKKYSELRGILHYIRKTFSQTGKGISEMIDYINKFSLEHNEAHQKPLKIITLEKPELISKHLGIVFVVDSGLEFLGNFISKILEESAVRWELLSLTELKKIDFDCDHILIFFNSSAVLDPKKPPLIDLLVAKFSKRIFSHHNF